MRNQLSEAVELGLDPNAARRAVRPPCHQHLLLVCGARVPLWPPPLQYVGPLSHTRLLGAAVRSVSSRAESPPLPEAFASFLAHGRGCAHSSQGSPPPHVRCAGRWGLHPHRDRDRHIQSFARRSFARVTCHTTSFGSFWLDLHLHILLG